MFNTYRKLELGYSVELEHIQTTIEDTYGGGGCLVKLIMVGVHHISLEYVAIA